MINQHDPPPRAGAASMEDGRPDPDTGSAAHQKDVEPPAPDRATTVAAGSPWAEWEDFCAALQSDDEK